MLLNDALKLITEAWQLWWACSRDQGVGGCAAQDCADKSHQNLGCGAMRQRCADSSHQRTGSCVAQAVQDLDRRMHAAESIKSDSTAMQLDCQ